MKSFLSINVHKIMMINPIYLFALLKERMDGIEISFDFNNEQEKKYVVDLTDYCKREDYPFNFHGDVNLDIDKQKEYFDFIDSITNKPTNVVLHSILVEEQTISINKTTVFIDKLLRYIDEKNYNITLSIENLNSMYGVYRLSKDFLDPILYNNKNLKFTYDIGHEIVDYGMITDLSDIKIDRINNVHIHNHINGLDHQIIRREDENFCKIIKGILYLLYIEYDGPIVYEYDLYLGEGDTYLEKVSNVIDTIEDIKQYYT